MRKSYLTIAIAAISFAACSDNTVKTDIQEDVVEIGFANGFMNNTTKAALSNSWFNTTGTTFGVFGYKQGTAATKVFDDETVTRTSDDWTHPNVRFWDKSAKYDFYAYAPATQTASFDDTNRKFKFEGIKANPIVDITTENSDLAVADRRVDVTYSSVATHTNPTDATGHGAGHVEFTFNHILSKLSFKVKSTASTSAVDKITVTDIKIAFPKAEKTTWTQSGTSSVDGEITYTNYSKTDKETYGVYVDSTKAITPGTTAVALGKTFIVAPVNSDCYSETVAETTKYYHEIGVTVTYDITYQKATGASTAVTDPGCVATGTVKIYPNQNDYYIVVIDINPAAIEFCVDKINGWTAAKDADVEVK